MATTIARDEAPADLIDETALRGQHPREIRRAAREGRLRTSNTKSVPGYAITTFIAFRKDVAFDFALFCQRNAAPAPMLEALDPGDPIVKKLAPGADVRTDIPQYRIYENGRLIDTPYDATPYWTDDMVGFMIGCSCSFEELVQTSGIRLRHLEEGEVGTIYSTKIDTTPAGPFAGPLAVSMRPIHWTQVSRVVQVSSRYPAYHGAPVHIGDPKILGIDLDKPWWGDVPTVKDDEVPVYWACSVTPQVVAAKAGLSFITNVPGSMFVTDTPMYELATLL